MTIRLNPLDTAPSRADGRVVDAAGDGADPAGRRRIELTASLAVACLGRELRAAGAGRRRRRPPAAARRAGDGAPTLPQVVDALLDPSAEAARRPPHRAGAA